MNIWQRLGHRLFGWHYLFFRYALYGNVMRVRVAPNGGRYIVYGSEVLLVHPTGFLWNDDHNCPYVPLTWSLPEHEQSQASLRVVK